MALSSLETRQSLSLFDLCKEASIQLGGREGEGSNRGRPSNRYESPRSIGVSMPVKGESEQSGFPRALPNQRFRRPVNGGPTMSRVVEWSIACMYLSGGLYDGQDLSRLYLRGSTAVLTELDLWYGGYSRIAVFYWDMRSDPMTGSEGFAKFGGRKNECSKSSFDSQLATIFSFCRYR